MLERNFVKTLEVSLKDNWERPCFSDYQGDTQSYSDIAKSILIFHEVFKTCGLKKGDKVAVCGKNSVNWAKVYLATVTYGGVIVPILPDFSPEDVANIVNHSDSRLFFAAEGLFKAQDFSTMPSLVGAGQLETFALLHNDGSVPADLVDQARKTVEDKWGTEVPKEAVSFEPVENDALAGLVYTSGTTGFSKGAMLSHNCLMANVDYAQKSIDVRSGDTIVSFLPIAHCFGCAFEFLFPFSVGCHITFLQRVSPQMIMKAFQEVHPRLILSVPLVIEKIYYKQLQPILRKPIAKIPVLKSILHRVIRKKLIKTFGGNFIEIVIGGAAFNPEVEAFLKKIKFPFTVGYGMTECGPLISYAPWKKYKGASSGKLIFHLEGKIDSPDPAKIQGEIMVRGENVMMGYYKNDEATKEVLQEDGWLRTGDMGTMDGDQNIFIKGRCKNMFLGPGGQNIYPEEIEARLNNVPIIAESLLLERDKHLVALVGLDADAVKEEGLSEDGIKEALEEARKSVNQALPAYSLVSEVAIHDEEFVKTPTMKIKRYLYK